MQRRSVDGVQDWLRITPWCRIPMAELRWHTTRSGGPGGQHANTADTAVQVVFDVNTSASLGERQRARLVERLGPTVRATSSDTRSQARNRDIALERLRGRLADGLRPRRHRRATEPSAAARAARVEAKRRRAQVKRSRRRPRVDDE